MVVLKKILLFVTCFFIFITLCSCGNHTDVNEDFVEGSLLFDIGASSIENVEWCKIINDGTIPEIFIGEDDFSLFAKYRFKSDYPFDKLHELLVFPKNKLINICIDGKEFALYLMEDGNIGVRISEEGFKLYQADKNNQITPEKYDNLVNEYKQ